MDDVKRILRYLKSTSWKLKGRYTDADQAASKDDRRSTSGYFTFVGGNLVTWKSKKQLVVARSSAEAEFRGKTLGVCELLWVKNVLSDLGFKLNEIGYNNCSQTCPT